MHHMCRSKRYLKIWLLLWMLHWDTSHLIHHVCLSVSQCPFFLFHVSVLICTCVCCWITCFFVSSHLVCCFHVLSITAVRIHNHTVLTTHNSSSVYTNDSAYTNISATVGEALTHVHLLVHSYGSWGIVLGPIHSCRPCISAGHH